MKSIRTIGLWSAVLININVIVGSGIFVNLHPLTAALGSGSFVVYLIAALFLLPVVTVLALLARQHPESGGLYVYTKTYLNPFVGFLGGWAYFVGKAISAGFMASMLMLVAKEALPVLHAVPHILLVAGLLLFLVGANVIGASLQGRVQWAFVAAKVIPVASVVALLVWRGPQVPVSFDFVTGDSLAAVVPIAVFAMVGFEVTSTIAHLFVRPEYTIIRAFIIGFLAVTALLSLFQGAVSLLLPASALAIGLPAAQLSSVAAAYLPTFASFSWLMTICVYLSMLGGTFGILTSNCWNMHRLAAQGHVPGGRWLTKLTAGQVPWVSLLVEVGICVLGVAISSKQIPLQKMSVLGVVFAFFCAMLAAWFARNAQGGRLIHPVVVGAALCSTLGLFCITLYHIYLYGISVPYLCLFGGGIAVALLHGWCSKHRENC
ncbi:MAG: basic amino acid/polyamine antiporter, family [Candidatus Dependentiae bacterium]|nr:basic amino acid/polyamine antiporter, family [Candidatus Dependentiae bacterium]